MTDYPKEGQKISLCTTDGAVLTGMVNVAGRSLSMYLQDSEPDIIMYDVELGENNNYKTLMVSKRQTIWISPFEECRKEEYGSWKKLSLKMIDGQIIIGEVDMTGCDRLSDYAQKYHNRFYELFDCIFNGENKKSLFVSNRHTLWKEPL